MLFNGEEAFKIGKEILEQKKDDNFYELLSIEPIALDFEDINESSSIPSFSLAEEKAVKAIQKHSMRINGVQRNSQVAKAYLLLGKSRYYDRRFFPAIEAFNYLLDQYSSEEIFLEAKIWREKTNLRLKNEELVINNLKSLSNNILKTNKLSSEINATISQAYINLNKIDSALTYIKKASFFEKNEKLQARYRFIEAQLYEQLGVFDSAKSIYKLIVKKNRKITRELWVQAKISELRLSSDLNLDQSIKGLELLSRKIENKNFNHFIFRAEAKLMQKSNQDSLALSYYKKSLASKFSDPVSKRLNYRDLADYYFKKSDFLITGLYLDSLLLIAPNNSPNKTKILREKKGIQLVINNENRVKKIDSVLILSRLSYNEQKDFFQKSMNKNLEKEKNEEKTTFSEQFYFYNPRLVSLGKEFFIQNWGKRPNIDNWNNYEAIKNKPILNQKPFKIKNNSLILESIEKKISLIPKDPNVLDSLVFQINQSYLVLGNIYREKFKNKALSSLRLNKVLSNNPSSNQKVDALYQLYKLNLEDNFKESNEYRDQILMEFPDSAYSIILSKIDDKIIENIPNPRKIYLNLMELFNKQKYEKVITSANELKPFLIGTSYIAKTQLLIANSIGRLDGVLLWKKELEKLMENFPNTEESKHVKKTLQLLAEKKENRTIFVQKKHMNYKWVFKFLKSDEVNINSFKSIIESYLKSNENLNWEVTIDVYNRKTNFVVIHTKKNILVKEKILENLMLNNQSIMVPNNFVLLKSEYLKMQLHKTFKE